MCRNGRDPGMEEISVDDEDGRGEDEGNFLKLPRMGDPKVLSSTLNQLVHNSTAIEKNAIIAIVYCCWLGV